MRPPEGFIEVLWIGLAIAICVVLVGVGFSVTMIIFRTVNYYLGVG
jgi:hypothetical protein